MNAVILIGALLMSVILVRRRNSEENKKNALWVELLALWLIAGWLIVLVPVLASWIGVPR